jgi:hypothetical protein
MLVKYKKKVEVSLFKTVTYKFISMESCCLEMKEAFEEFVVFGEIDSYGINMDNKVNITKCNSYPEGAVFSEMAISFCPFCGKEIKIEEII